MPRAIDHPGEGTSARAIATREGKDPTRPTVLVVSHEASRTGAPRVAVELLHALRAAGYRTVVAHRWGGPLESELNAAADDHIDEPLRRVRAGLRRWPRTKGLADRLERSSAHRVIRRIRPDLVWCNTSIPWRYAAVATSAGVPAVLYGHEQSEWTGTLERSFEQRSADSAGSITVAGCSTSASNVLADALHVDTGAIELLHSPVDVEGLLARAASARLVDDERTVVACGPAIDKKGFDVFVEAARKADGDGVAGMWRWIGRPPVNPPSLPPNVQLLGEIDDPAPEIATSDVFVCPSRVDSFPLVVLEAMALARPVVASHLGGIEEQLGDTGILVPTGDASALLEGVRRTVADPEWARELGEQAQARCRSHWDVSVFRQRVREIAGRALAAP